MGQWNDQRLALLSHFVIQAMPVQKTPAIVIRIHPLGEYDRIVTFYTAHFGKVRAVGRGARRPRSRLGGSLELLNHGTLVYFERPNKDLHVINDFDVTTAFDGIKADFERTSYACYLAELVNAIEPSESVNQSVFQLLKSSFEGLAQVDDVPLFTRAFELHLLELAGFAPQLTHCVDCRKPIPNVPKAVFSSNLGGLLCADCADRDARAVTISRGSCELMKQLQKSDFDRLHRFRASTLNHRELKRVLVEFISYHTERSLKSLAFIEEVGV